MANAGAARRPRLMAKAVVGAPIHQSLVNPVLIAGMERKPAQHLLITVATLILGPGFHLYTLALAAILLIVGTFVLARLANSDPEFIKGIVRYLTYDKVYDPDAPAGIRKGFFESTFALAGPLRPAVPTPREA